ARAEGALARRHARLRHRPAPSTARRRHADGRRGDPLPGALSSRAARVDRRRVGRVRQQPPRTVLRAHSRRPQAARRRSRRVEPPVAGNRESDARMTRWLTRLLAPWRSARIRREIADEIQFHIDRRTEDHVRAGMPPDVARREAERRFGPRLQTAEAGYEVRGAAWFDETKTDVRFAARMLIKHRGFSAAAIVTLALGIGANLAIFTLVNAVLLRPLPFRDPERLVRVFDDLNDARAKDVGMSVPEFTDLQRHTDIFEQIAVAF